MGNVIEVKFGLERDLNQLKSAIEDGIRRTLTQFQPGKADRAAQIADEAVELLREFSEQAAMRLSTSYKVPAGISSTDAAAIADSVSTQIAAQVKIELDRLIGEAGKRIFDAVSRTVLLVVAE